MANKPLDRKSTSDAPPAYAPPPAQPSSAPSQAGPSSSTNPFQTPPQNYATFAPPPGKPDPRDIRTPYPDFPGVTAVFPNERGFAPVGMKVVSPGEQVPDLNVGRTVYYYRNPMNGATISSFLPPDHPRSLCLQHGHIPLTTYGLLGILTAIIFFPVGILCCMVDRRSVCGRCGEVLSGGCT